MLTAKIKGYLISHSHLDHVAGLIIASPDDSQKPIYALPSVTADLVETYFNWKAWPNLTDRGKAPQLKKYTIEDLAPGVATPLRDTAMTVTAFPLSHGGMESTTFLLESDGEGILCFGDTGPDAVQKGTHLHDVWTAVADRVKQKRLKAIVIEVVLHQRPAGQPAVRPPDAALAAGLAARPRPTGRRQRPQGPAGGREPHQVFADEGTAAEADAAGARGRQRPRRALRDPRAGQPLALQVSAVLSHASPV